MKLTDMEWKLGEEMRRPPSLNQSPRGNPIMLAGTVYENGIGTRANSIIEYDLPGGFDRFTAKAGILEEEQSMPGNSGQGVMFLVYLQDPSGEIPPDSEEISVSFDEMGLTGAYRVRDLWAKEDIGSYEDGFSREIRRHASGLYRLSRVNN